MTTLSKTELALFNSKMKSVLSMLMSEMQPPSPLKRGYKEAQSLLYPEIHHWVACPDSSNSPSRTVGIIARCNSERVTIEVIDGATCMATANIDKWQVMSVPEINACIEVPKIIW